RQRAGIRRGAGSVTLLHDGQPLAPPGLGAIELPQLLLAIGQVVNDATGTGVSKTSFFEVANSLLEQWERHLRLLRALIAAGQVVHREYRVDMVTAELRRLKLEHVRPELERFVQPVCGAIARCQAVHGGQSIRVIE